MPPVSDLSRLIPLSARVILTPGGDDAGAAYKRLNPGASVRSDGGGPADCIVIDRALTATREPPGLLRRYVQDLAPNGVMVIEIANPAYWREAAIQPERGTFDATSMRRDLGELGLVAADVQAVITDEAAGRAHIEAITPELRDRGIDPGEYAETALPEAFIWRVAREMPDQLIVAGDMLRPVGGVSHLRVVHPLRAMAAEPGVSTYLASSASPPEIPRSETTPKIFILHRPALVGAHGQGIVDGLIGKGWLVVTEFDDHPDFLRGMNNPALLSFHGVHAVQTTTPALAEVLRTRNPELR